MENVFIVSIFLFILISIKIYVILKQNKEDTLITKIIEFDQPYKDILMLNYQSPLLNLVDINLTDKYFENLIVFFHGPDWLYKINVKKWGGNDIKKIDNFPATSDSFVMIYCRKKNNYKKINDLEAFFSIYNQKKGGGRAINENQGSNNSSRKGYLR